MAASAAACASEGALEPPTLDPPNARCSLPEPHQNLRPMVALGPRSTSVNELKVRVEGGSATADRELTRLGASVVRSRVW